MDIPCSQISLIMSVGHKERGQVTNLMFYMKHLVNLMEDDDMKKCLMKIILELEFNGRSFKVVHFSKEITTSSGLIAFEEDGQWYEYDSNNVVSMTIVPDTTF